MIKLKKMLEKVEKSYPEFVDSIINDCARHGEELKEKIISFINENPSANSSDVLEYELYLIGLPYCDDNGIWHQKDRIITEQEAIEIVESQFHDD